MLKFLAILLSVIVGIFLFLGWILKKVRKIFVPFQQAQNSAGSQKSEQRTRSDGNVIYKKDDVVVMKGEAGKKNK